MTPIEKSLIDNIGFAFFKGDESREAMAICSVCSYYRIPYKQFDKAENVPSNFVAVGSVEWCESVFKKSIKPDYYPEFLKDHLHRDIWYASYFPCQKRFFIKPADRYKRFDGWVALDGFNDRDVEGPFICSSLLRFTNEWRYYVSDGKILASGWYKGKIEDEEAPELNIEIPIDYCGALDFGRTEFNNIALVEAQHPFACGWYGKNSVLYVEWLIKGWKYMQKQLAKS